jgi:hypothetical protein
LPPLFAVVGGGFAAYDESTLRTDGNPNVGSQSNHTGAVAIGGGIDVHSGSWLGLRGEVRDVISGARRFAIPTPGERVQNLVATIGLVSALERPPGPPADALLQLLTSTSPVAVLLSWGQFGGTRRCLSGSRGFSAQICSESFEFRAIRNPRQVRLPPPPVRLTLRLAGGEPQGSLKASHRQGEML